MDHEVTLRDTSNSRVPLRSVSFVRTVDATFAHFHIVTRKKEIEYGRFVRHDDRLRIACRSTRQLQIRDGVTRQLGLIVTQSLDEIGHIRCFLSRRRDVPST
jgi:hypothetical protein